MLAMSHPRKLVSVLYKKRKFAHKEQTDTQTFQKLKSTLFLYGSSPDTRGSWPIKLAQADYTQNNFKILRQLFSAALCIKTY